MPAIKKSPAQKREENIKAALRIGLARNDMKKIDVARRTKLSATTISQVFSDPLGREFRSVIVVADLLGVNLFSDDICNK